KSELSQSKAKLSIYETPSRAELALVSAEQEFNTLKLRYRSKHPNFIEAERRVEQATEQLRKSLARVVANATDQEYWKKYPDIVAGLENEKGFDDLREKLIERRAQLETEIDSQSTISETLLTQVETSEINKVQNEAEVLPYEKARRSNVPVTEGKVAQVSKSSLLGLVGGGAFALLFMFLDNKFHSVDDLERQVSLPILAAIPKMDDKVLKKLKGGILKGRDAWASTLIFRREDTQTVIAESFRILRAAVSLLGPAEERKTTLVTSSLPSEGKTTVASNFACAMAQEGKKVILVDLDLRKPSVHKGFGKSKDGKKGVVDILTANAEISETLITDTGLDNLHLMLSGPKAPNPGELLDSSRLKELIAQLSEKYDHVVIDSAPVMAVADSRLLAPLVDNFIFVVRAESTPKGALGAALEILESDGRSPSGLVLNNFEQNRISGGKNYRYGYYRSGQYTYGSYGSDED
ncbi:polysaccharide biosynthesis tyrosine autokinase, partial [bacterium]|nr:polysaccharide biosynthesis tyrosine autokinase [bacterium]